MVVQNGVNNISYNNFVMLHNLLKQHKRERDKTKGLTSKNNYLVIIQELTGKEVIERIQWRPNKM